jgi:hypothetical protein
LIPFSRMPCPGARTLGGGAWGWCGGALSPGRPGAFVVGGGTVAVLLLRAVQQPAVLPAMLAMRCAWRAMHTHKVVCGLCLCHVQFGVIEDIHCDS